MGKEQIQRTQAKNIKETPRNQTKSGKTGSPHGGQFVDIKFSTKK